MKIWTEAEIKAALEGHFYGLDGVCKRQRQAQIEAEKAKERQARAEMLREQTKQITSDRIAAAGFTAHSIIIAVAFAHGIGASDLVSRSRARHIALARQHACFIMREFTGMPLHAIAAAVGLADHSTVKHSCGRWRRLRHLYEEQDQIAKTMLGVQI